MEQNLNEGEEHEEGTRPLKVGSPAHKEERLGP